MEIWVFGDGLRVKKVKALAPRIARREKGTRVVLWSIGITGLFLGQGGKRQKRRLVRSFEFSEGACSTNLSAD